MYGRYPAKPEKVTAKVLFEDAKAFDGKGTLREVEIDVRPAGVAEDLPARRGAEREDAGRVLRRAELRRQPPAHRPREGPHPDRLDAATATPAW